MSPLTIKDLIKQRQATKTAPISVTAVIPPNSATTSTPTSATTSATTTSTTTSPTNTSPNTPPNTPPPLPPHSSLSVSDLATSTALQSKISNIRITEAEHAAQVSAASLGLPTIELLGFPINPEALALIPEAIAKDHGLISFFFNGPEIRIGVTSPQDPYINELTFELSERHHANVKQYLISQNSFKVAFKAYASLPKIKTITKGISITATELDSATSNMTDLRAIASMLQKANATDVLTLIIAASIKLKSSDIHIEAEEKGIVIRFRLDGLLQEIAVIDRIQWKKIINRIKLVASLKLNISDRAQDGRFTIFQKEGEIDVRMSTIPTAYGESVVMRLLNPDAISLDINLLGFRPAVLKKLEREISRPNGMIITTGPTGSGKTTTLYAILKQLNQPDVKIITLEDPIEYRLEGLNQSQIDPTKNYTFANGLRSLLRQDPDIIMVGEIRDIETAEIAVQASLTGHLLLSTIHTNDAAGAVPRFQSMGVPPHLLAPALNLIMGQRLIRKLCQACKEAYSPIREDLEIINQNINNISEASGETKPDLSTAKWFEPRTGGCEKCQSSGYKGRLGVYEILIKTPAVEAAILKGNTSEYEMRAIAHAQGMTTMLQDGILKALEGQTSISELKRVVGLA